MKAKTSPCRICKEKTPYVFNIKFKPVPICDDCANSIVLQQIQDLVGKKSKRVEAE